MTTPEDVERTKRAQEAAGQRPAIGPTVAGFLVGFVLSLITSGILFDDGPGLEWTHVAVATAGGTVGALLGSLVRR